GTPAVRGGELSRSAARLPGVVGAPTPARLARTARPGRAVAKGPNRPGSAPLVLHAEAHQPAAFRGGFIVAGAGAVDDQRADILTVGDVVQPGEGFDGHVAKGMAITAPPVHNGDRKSTRLNSSHVKI